MDENWPDGSTSTTAPTCPDATENQGWGRRPRRSATDRKIAGVAGGLGRAFGIDPILIRVVFVVLTVFGGFGGLLYVLGWLLLPSDHDEVSAAEALLGRGRSSVPPVLAVGLGVVAVVSLFSMFSWGLPFWPLVVAGVVMVAIMRKRSAGHGYNWADANAARWDARAQAQARRWDAHAERHARRWGARADRWSRQAAQWGDQAERWVASQTWARGDQQESGGCGSWLGGRRAPGGLTDSNTAPAGSPFDRPAFWDEPSAATRVDSPPPSGVRMTKNPNRPNDDRPADATFTASGRDAPMDAPRTPPAWDPLGVAPFAWDLPEPTPVPAPPAPRSPGGSVISRVTIGLTLLAGGLATAGIFAGWWALSWGQVAAVALTVVALGLLVSALRGRGYALVGPGVFLSLVTLALTLTGLRGTDGFGDYTWQPTTLAQVQSSYEINAGNARLDLSQLTVPTGITLPMSVEVHAGNAVITLPKDTQVNVTCTANAGEVECLDQTATGLNSVRQASQSGASARGTINLTVEVGAGHAEVRNG